MIESCYIRVDGKEFKVDFAHPQDLSIPLKPGLENPNCYHTSPVNMETIRGKNFVGSVREGGACNHRQITLAPHGNGTHTECYGHIAAETSATINHCLKHFHYLAQLITVEPTISNRGDRIITDDVMFALGNKTTTKALIIRTTPNERSKLTRQYSGTNPPYLSTTLVEKLVGRGVEHLLVDLPSVDPEEDGGKLSAHKVFWNYPKSVRKNCTITELIYVPNSVADGIYLLNLQIISLESDASPSKPLLYPLI